jgi:hypothetical protein
MFVARAAPSVYVQAVQQFGENTAPAVAERLQEGCLLLVEDPDCVLFCGEAGPGRVNHERPAVHLSGAELDRLLA